MKIYGIISLLFSIAFINAMEHKTIESHEEYGDRYTHLKKVHKDKVIRTAFFRKQAKNKEDNKNQKLLWSPDSQEQKRKYVKLSLVGTARLKAKHS